MRSIASRMSVMSGEGALSIFARAKELEAQGRSIIHLELGEPDFHPGASVIQSAAKALAEGKDRYCAVIGVPELREEIAAYLHSTRGIEVSAANVVLAPGCKAMVFFAMMALLEPGDEVLYPDPGFPGYPSITLGFAGVPVPFELSPQKCFQPDLSEVAAKITRRTRMIILNSPGNPHRNRVHRRSAAGIGRTCREARSVGPQRRDLRAHYLWARISFNVAVSGDGGTNAHH